jgi:hypothetical protein
MVDWGCLGKSTFPNLIRVKAAPLLALSNPPEMRRATHATGLIAPTLSNALANPDVVAQDYEWQPSPNRTLQGTDSQMLVVFRSPRCSQKQE